MKKKKAVKPKVDQNTPSTLKNVGYVVPENASEKTDFSSWDGFIKTFK